MNAEITEAKKINLTRDFLHITNLTRNELETKGRKKACKVESEKKMKMKGTSRSLRLSWCAVNLRWKSQTKENANTEYTLITLKDKTEHN